MYNLTKSKKLAIAAITTIAVLLPECAYSLGIGDIKLHSKLNQNLKGEIELLTSANEEISDLYVGLASPEKFDEAGIPWNYFLKNIKFKPVKRANGSIVIELTSNESLKELFLSFVLEVSWNKSNLLQREFTVLVDPSSTYNPVSVSPRHKKKPITENTSSFLNSLENENINRKGTAQYGPIKRTDFIWKIAKKTRYPDVSIEQMIMALYKANPNAFYADNINSLAVKEMLNVPDKELALEMSRKEALAAVKQQNMEWKERNVANKTLAPETVAELAKVSSQIASEPFDLNLTKKVSAFSDRGASFNNAQKTNNNAQKTKEKPPTVISSAEGLALLARLEKLEQKLDILISKDKQATTATSAADNAETKPQPLVSSAEGLALLTRQNELEQKLEMMQKMHVSNDKPSPPQQAPKQPAAALPASLAPQSVEPDKPVATTALSPITQESETNPVLLALYGMGGGLFLGALGCFWWLNRKKQQENELEKTSKYSSPGLSIPPVDQMIAKDQGFLPDPIDAFDSERIDSIAETDMYLAYGFYDKAEALMRQSIKQHPEKNEYHLKLLEIFLASENKAAFYAYVSKLTSKGENNDLAFLESIAKMEAALHSETVFDLSKFDAAPAANASLETAENKQPDIKLSEELETATNSETAFDSSGFDAEPAANTNVEIIDDNQLNTESFDDESTANHEIAFDISDFEVEPVLDTSIEVADNNPFDSEPFDDEPAFNNKVEFDLLDFDTEPVANTAIEAVEDKQEDIELTDGEPLVSHDIAFDLSGFDTESAANTAIEVVEDKPEDIELADDAKTATGKAIIFDLSDFDIEPVTNANVETVDDK